MIHFVMKMRSNKKQHWEFVLLQRMKVMLMGGSQNWMLKLKLCVLEVLLQRMVYLIWMIMTRLIWRIQDILVIKDDAFRLWLVLGGLIVVILINCIGIYRWLY